jgi:RNA polymerase sigma factor (sigma-70 family)
MSVSVGHSVSIAAIDPAETSNPPPFLPDDGPAWPKPQISGPIAHLDEGVRHELSRLWQEHRLFLRGIARQWLRRHPSDIDDVVSDVILRAGTMLALRHEIVLRERAWLARLLYNRCIDLQRRFRTAEQIVQSIAHDPQTEEPAEFGDESPSAEQQLLRRELSTMLRRAIRNLPDGLRGPVIMRLIEEAPYELIAQTYGLTTVNARKRIQQGRALLRECLVTYLRSGAAAKAVRTARTASATATAQPLHKTRRRSSDPIGAHSAPSTVPASSKG